jgi:hypothetical protein
MKVNRFAAVTLSAGEMLEILRWLNPAGSPRITMGARG